MKLSYTALMVAATALRCEAKLSSRNPKHAAMLDEVATALQIVAAGAGVIELE